jgi:hypothetical protein
MTLNISVSKAIKNMQMKKILRYSFLMVAVAVVINACRKEDNPRLPELERFEWMPLIVKDQTASINIPGQDPESFAGKFTIDKYFETDINPQKVDVVVIKNGDKTTVKTIKADVTTFPATVDVTGTQLITLFGPIVLGDNFTVGVDITTPGGKKFEAFPLVGNAYAAGIAAQPGASTTINYLSACAFDKNSFNGTYEVVEDEWADFAAGDPIEVKPGPGDDQISITAFPSPAYGTNRKAFLIDVNPASFAVTIAEQVIGDYSGAPPNATIRGTGTVNPCGDRIRLTVTFKIGGVDYTDYVFEVKK